MLTIDNNTIYFTKGDTAYLDISLIYADEKPYVAHEGDTITLSLKRNILDSDYSLQKVVNAGETIVFNPDDTKDLTAGKYVYDVQLDTSAKEVFTIIPTSDFYLMEGVTG